MEGEAGHALGSQPPDAESEQQRPLLPEETWRASGRRRVRSGETSQAKGVGNTWVLTK